MYIIYIYITYIQTHILHIHIHIHTYTYIYVYICITHTHIKSSSLFSLDNRAQVDLWYKAISVDLIHQEHLKWAGVMAQQLGTLA